MSVIRAIDFFKKYFKFQAYEKEGATWESDKTDQRTTDRLTPTEMKLVLRDRA
jgi:hypothetical protein